MIRHARRLPFLLLSIASLAACDSAPDPASKADVAPPRDTLVLDPSLRQTLSVSRWSDAERKRYRDLLSSQACDTLVVPVQNKGQGFDRATRSLMTAQLASLLAGDPRRCVVDPYLASRALGDGERRFAEGLVKEFADSVQARTIVWMYVSHNGKFQLQMQLRVDTRRRGSGQFTRSMVNVLAPIAFSDEAPPFVAWKPRLAEIAGLLDVAMPTPEPADGATFALPAQPADLVEPTVKSLRQAANAYAMLAALGPPREHRATERLHEKSWLAADATVDDAESRRLRARALFHLGYRPAAIATLRNDTGAEATVLRALLDGNLPDAEKALVDVRAPLDRLAASLEVVDLRFAYLPIQYVDNPPQALVEATGQSAMWSTLLAQRSEDGKEKYVGDNLSIKQVLDQAYPVEGYALMQLRGDDRYDLLMPARHVAKVFEQRAAKPCCGTFALRPGSLDLLDLLDARGEFNAESAVDYQARKLGLPEKAAEILDRCDAVYAGHPHFDMLRAEATLKIALDRPNGKYDALVQVSSPAAQRAAFAEHGLTTTSVRAMIALGVPSRQSSPFLDAYATDFPPRPYWYWPDSPAALERSLAYATTLPDSLAGRLAIPDDPARPSPLVAAAAQRFRGSPAVAKLRLASAQSGDAQADIATMREIVRQDPGNWSGYAALATSLVQNGEYDAAKEVVVGYPGLKPGSAESTVGLANRIHQIARLLYWSGAADQARALYEIGASYDNGSEAEMIAGIRVRVLAGDFEGARSALQRRIERYNNPYGYNEYLAWSFVLGASREAWEIFNEVAGRFDDPIVWQAALIGLRVDGRTDREVIDWATSEPIRSVTATSDQPALRFGLSAFVLDRVPPDDLARALARIEGPPQATADDEGGVRSSDGNHEPRSDYKPKTPASSNTGDPVASGYVLFADAYVRQRRGDHAAAVDAFDRLARYYRIEGGDLSFALPYFAYSAAKTGDKVQLRAFIDALPPLQARRFHTQLAQAVFAGVAKEHEAALDRLRKAFAVLPPVEGRYAQIPAYQYAEVCVLLFQETGDKRYRGLALDWARKMQRIDPTYAWAYALQARFGDPQDKDRIRATAIATYLDRHSAWLREVPKADRDGAREWLKRNKPFATSAKKAAAG